MGRCPTRQVACALSTCSTTRAPSLRFAGEGWPSPGLRRGRSALSLCCDNRGSGRGCPPEIVPNNRWNVIASRGAGSTLYFLFFFLYRQTVHFRKLAAVAGAAHARAPFGMPLGLGAGNRLAARRGRGLAQLARSSPEGDAMRAGLSLSALLPSRPML